MFRLNKTRDIVTIFHKASCPASVRIVEAVKKASIKSQAAAAAAGSASNDLHGTKHRRDPFELDIMEGPATLDQVRTILDYAGAARCRNIINGARDKADAIKIFKSDEGSLERPLTVDWSNGVAISGSDESKVLEMLAASEKD